MPNPSERSEAIRMSLDDVRHEAKRLAGEVVVAWADQTTAYAVAADVDELLAKLNRLGLEPTGVILETIPPHAAARRGHGTPRERSGWKA